MKYGLIQFDILPSASFGKDLRIILINQNTVFPINTYEEVLKLKTESNNKINIELQQNENGEFVIA